MRRVVRSLQFPLDGRSAACNRRCRLASWFAVGLLAWSCTQAQDQEPAEHAGCDQHASCRDCDCDTICDQDEGATQGSDCEHSSGRDRDSDGDGKPDYLDEDSDNDGHLDVDEAGDDDLTTEPCENGMDPGCGYLNPNYPVRQERDSGALDAGTQTRRRDSGPPDAAAPAPKDGGGVYELEDADAIYVPECPPEDRIPSGCVDELDEGARQLCDQLDNDCDGEVDENCHCGAPGGVQPCFLGPPGQRGHGACHDGVQVCRFVDEFTYRWGPCEGSRQPTAESCDGIDNDCNGCTDEVEGCAVRGSCPDPNGDPRVPAAQPFASYPLEGEAFYWGEDAVAWQWEISGSPCDRLFQSIDPNATSESGHLSYHLQGAQEREAVVDFSLSGAYQVALSVTREDSSVFRCTWPVTARADGLRIELCWDKTGPIATSRQDAVDLDLHLGKTPETTAWFADTDCYWLSCSSADTPWGYADTDDLHRCTGEGAENYELYSFLGHCPNPRLDMDNRDLRSGQYVTENINLDNPKAGDQFRVMVHYYTNAHADSGDPQDGGVAAAIEAHPLLNVYCAGRLKGSLGGGPDHANRLHGFDTPGQTWRAFDIEQGAGPEDCRLDPIRPSDAGALHDIRDQGDAF